jgi:hypothetical protein
MPGNTKQRKRKHRGKQTGSIERRGRTTAKGRQQPTSRGGRPDPRDRPPDWGASMKRGGFFALLLFPIALLLGQPIAAAIVLTVLGAAFYIPLGYYVDGFVYRRRQAKLQAERAVRRRPTRASLGPWTSAPSPSARWPRTATSSAARAPTAG